MEYDFDSAKRCTHNSVEDQIYTLRKNIEWLEKTIDCASHIKKEQVDNACS